MILAAGLGTRLRPLTLVRPKVLAPIYGTSVLDFWIWRLHHAGIEAVLINAYHLHERVVAAVHDKHWPIPVQVRVEPVLLGTGGGISNVLEFFEGQPFLVVNGDIICDAPLADLRHQHFESESPAGLLLHDYPEFNNVAVTSHGRVLGFGREARGLALESSDRECLAFAGIHIIHPGIFDGFPPGQPGDGVPRRRRVHEGPAKGSSSTCMPASFASMQFESNFAQFRNPHRFIQTRNCSSGPGRWSSVWLILRIL